MIRREEPESIWVINQAAHAYLSGQIGEHWRMAYAPREELLIAAYTHDTGWSAADRTPRLNARGLPRTFTEMDLEEHFTIWLGSINAVFLQNRYAGLLTSLHCSALYDQRLRYIQDNPEDRAKVQSFLGERRAWEKHLINALAEHPRYASAIKADRLAENLRLLQVWDYLSLLLCMGPVNDQTLDDVPLQSGERGVLAAAACGLRGLEIDPFPLDQPLTLWIDARQISRGPFADHSAFQSALEFAPYQPLVLEVVRP